MADVSLLFNVLVRDNTAGGLNSASSRMDKFRAATSMAAVGIMGAAAVMGKKAVEIASDTAESSSKVQTLLGDSSRAAMEFAETSAKAYGISKREALGAVGNIAAVDRAMGTNAKEASKLAVEYVQLSADLGSFNNASSAEVQEALTASIAGEYEMLKRYGIVVNDVTLSQEAQRIGMKKTGATWDSAQKRQLSYNIIMRSTKAAQGDFARTQGGLANQTKTAAAQMEDLQGKLGEKLLPAAVKVVSKLVEMVTWVENNQGKAKALAIAVGAVAGVIVTAALGMKAYRAALMVARAATAAHTAVMWALNAAFLANPIVGVIAIIVALGVAMVVAYKKSETFRNIVNGAFGAVKKFFLAMWDTMRFAAGKGIKFIGGLYITFADGVLAVFEGLLRGAAKLPRWLGGGKFDAAADAVASIRGGLDALKRKLDEIPTEHEIRFRADVGSALQNIEMLRRAKAGLGTSASGVDLTSGGGQVQGRYGGMRANGGPVRRGMTYLVGERGPELFTAKSSGTIIPNGGARQRSNPAAGMARYGSFVVDGFAKGVKGREKLVDAAMQKVSERVSAAIDKMQAAVQRSRDIAAGIRESFASFADISNVETGQGFLAAIHDRADKAQAFARGISDLRKKGLSKSAIEQLVAAGPEGGLGTVEQLLNRGGIGAVNADLARIKAAGAELGLREAIARTGVDPRDEGRAVIGRGKDRTVVDLKLSGDGNDLVEAIVKALRKKIRASGGDVNVVLGTR